MSQIGTLKPDQVGGRECLRGHINSLTLRFGILLVPTGEPESSNRPSYRMYAELAADTDVEVGAAWRKPLPNRGGSFLSLNFDDPSFDRPVNVAAFPDDTGESYAITWRRRHDRHADKPSS